MDNACPHTFAQLAHEVLPAYMALLRLANPYPMTIFHTPGQGPAAILPQIGRAADLRAAMHNRWSYLWAAIATLAPLVAPVSLAHVGATGTSR